AATTTSVTPHRKRSRPSMDSGEFWYSVGHSAATEPGARGLGPRGFADSGPRFGWLRRPYLSHSGPLMRFGTVTLIGRSNVGKSTFLNTVLGEPLAITSPLPQTTRDVLLGVAQHADAQI